MLLLKVKREGSNDLITWKYDNLNGVIWDENGNVLGEPIDEDELETFEPRYFPDSNNHKQKRILTKLAIFLGQKCNFKCSYCTEQFLKDNKYDASPKLVKPFTEKLFKTIKEDPLIIDLWGGEPLVYWKTVKLLLPLLRKKYSTSKIIVRTNGSLLDDDKIDFFIKNNIIVSVSDDINNIVRGEDAIKNQVKWPDYDRWSKLMGKLFMFGIVINPFNCDIIELSKIIEKNFPNINFIKFNPLRTPNNSSKSIFNFSEEQLKLYFSTSYLKLTKTQANYNKTSLLKTNCMYLFLNFHNLNATGRKGNMANHGKYIDGFCDAPMGERLQVDLHGRVVRCKLSNSEDYCVGTLDDLDKIKYLGFTSSLSRTYCKNCPVISSCRGVCGLASQESLDLSCPQKYVNFYVGFKAAVEEMGKCELNAVESDDGEIPPIAKLLNYYKPTYNNQMDNAKKVLKIKSVEYDETLASDDV